MTNKKNQNSFIKQAGILAVAGIVCRLIGSLYRSPLAGIIGDEGNGYYSVAYNIYTIILLVSSYSIPSAISKIIAQRLAVGEYKNARRIFLCSLFYVVAAGGIASLFTYFGAGLLVKSEAVPILRIFAPTIFLSGILGVFRGYYQARGTMVQTAISQVLEQLINAAVSLIAAYFLMDMAAGKGSSAQAIYGASGSALGTGAGVLTALLFMLFIYLFNRKSTYKGLNYSGDKDNQVLPYGNILKIIISMVTPVILSTFIYNFNTTLNQSLYIQSMILKHNYSFKNASTYYGIFSGKAVVISNIPIAIASAMSSAIIPELSASFAKGELNATKQKITASIRSALLIAIPSAAGIAALSEPIVRLLFNQPESIALTVSLLRGLSLTIIFYALSTITNAVLQAIGQVKLPVINAAASLALQTIIVLPLLLFTDLKLYSLVIAAFVYSMSMCVLNWISIRKSLGRDFTLPFVKMFLTPSLIAVIMGILTAVAYELCNKAFQRNSISLMIAVVLGVLVYFVGIIITGVLTKEELEHFPLGDKLIRLTRKLCIKLHT